MIVNSRTRGPMRHIPEEELHAYLDQGLSRSQCVEIESHLADCPACQATRDRIAALRDQTTALLARLAPARSLPPAFDTLRRRAAEQASERRRRLQNALWVASLVVAVGLGWAGSYLLGPASARRSPARVANAAIARSESRPPAQEAPKTPGPVNLPAASRPAPAARDSMPGRLSPRPAGSKKAAREIRNDSVTAAVLAVLNPAPALELTVLDTSRSEGSEFGGMWRTMSWDGAQAEAGQPLPHIDGLPVVQVQVQAGEQGQRPLMVVAQQLSSGQVIRTIEGPATDVSQLLARRDPDSVVLRTDSSPPRHDPIGQAMAMQLGDRMLAITGSLPPDSLRAMIRRLNAEMRSK
jgi:putative zinc finger protein